MAAFVAFTVILGAIVAFDSFLDEQAPSYGDVDDTEVIGSDHEVYAPETDDEKAIFDVATSRLGSVASGNDEVLHAAIANDFADCVLDYTGESAASFGLDADAYADWAMRSLVYEVDWVYVDDEADEATVYYYANSYRSYDVAREVCYAIADGVDAQEALSNACENAEMGYELFFDGRLGESRRRVAHRRVGVGRPQRKRPVVAVRVENSSSGTLPLVDFEQRASACLWRRTFRNVDGLILSRVPFLRL